MMMMMMLRKGKAKSAAAHLAAGFILACYLAQTVNCYRLKKTERRVSVADSAKTIGVQEGTIVFGAVLEDESALESRVVNVTSKASVQDKTFQADSADWSKGQAHHASAGDVSWKRMAPSLQCGVDQMRFRAVGPGASQFAVEQGNAPPMPLSQVPSTCGYSMQRNSLALVMLVPYNGCNMVQEGGSYMLPMRWQGIPVSLWCPKPEAPAAPSAVPQTPKDPPSNPEVPQMPTVPHESKNPEVSNSQIPPYVFSPYLAYQYPSVVVPQPAATTTTTKEKPEMLKFPQYPAYFPPNAYFPPPLPVKTAATSTSKLITAKPAAKAPPQVFQYPHYQTLYPPFPWHLPGPLPTTAATTTTKATTTTPSQNTMWPQMPQLPQGPTWPQMPQLPQGPTWPQMPQLPQGPMWPQMPQGPMWPQFTPFGPFLPHYHSYPHPPFVPYSPTSKPEDATTTAAPTTTTTTTEKTEPILTPAMHHHPHVHHPHVHHPHVHHPHVHQPPVNLPFPLLPYHFLYPPQV